MKTSIKLFIFGCMFALASSFSLASDQSFEEEVSEGDMRIICNCTAFSNCRVSGSSGVCAQSEPGGNIQCSQWNSNC